MGTIKVRRPRVVVQVAGVNARKGEDLFEAIRLADASVAIDLEGRYPVPKSFPSSRISWKPRRRRCALVARASFQS
jgi:hypothetical protein